MNAAKLVEALRNAGHDVVFAVESLRGAPDEEVLARAFAEERNLITDDKDFGDLVYRPRKPVRGLILLRFEAADRHLKVPRLLDLMVDEAVRLPGSFVVLEADKVRVRPLIEPGS